MSGNLNIREFSTQVRQIVFLAFLAVFLLIKTVWAKMLKNSYLWEFKAQVSQIVLLSY